MAQIRDTENPNDEVVTIVYDIAANEAREVRVKRFEVWRSVLGLDETVERAQVVAAWQAHKDGQLAEAQQQHRRSAEVREAALRLREFDPQAFAALNEGIQDEKTRAALAAIAGLLADFRTVLRDGRP